MIRCPTLLPLLLALTATPAIAGSFVFVATKDNTLIESSTGALSNGIGWSLSVGRTAQPVGSSIRRGVIAFGLGEIPAGSTIDLVRFYLHCEDVSPGPARAVALHRLLADWGEGTSNAGIPGTAGAPATTGDATWLHRFFPGTLWSSGGGDFSPIASATQIVPGNSFVLWGSTPEMVSDVQSWLDAPGTNFGWLLQGDESVGNTEIRFDSRQIEIPIPSLRPVLIVEYTLPPTANATASWGRIKALYH